jgi:hypothetical protein
MRLLLPLSLGLALLPGVAQAYVGPGLSIGAIGAVFAVIGAVLLSVFAAVYYPVKRTLRKRRAAKQAEAVKIAGGQATDPAE